MLKVGSSCALKLDTVKRLKTIASACEVPESAAHGLLVALNKYEALLAGIGTREGSRQVLETIGPLSDAVVFAKRAIRCAFFCQSNSAHCWCGDAVVCVYCTVAVDDSTACTEYRTPNNKK